MVETVELQQAQDQLAGLTDRAHEGHVIVVTHAGQEVAVLIGIDEYRRLKDIDAQDRERDFQTLLTPPADELTEDEARQLALDVVREVRARRQQG